MFTLGSLGIGLTSVVATQQFPAQSGFIESEDVVQYIIGMLLVIGMPSRHVDHFRIRDVHIVLQTAHSRAIQQSFLNWVLGN